MQWAALTPWATLSHTYSLRETMHYQAHRGVSNIGNKLLVLQKNNLKSVVTSLTIFGQIVSS